MPQIWLSCEELAEALEIEPSLVRLQARVGRRETRVGADGTPWILLSDAMAREYLQVLLAEMAEPAAEPAASQVDESCDAVPDVEMAPPQDAEVVALPVADIRPKLPAAAAGPGASNVTFWDRYRRSLPRAGRVLDFVRSRASA